MIKKNNIIWTGNRSKRDTGSSSVADQHADKESEGHHGHAEQPKQKEECAEIVLQEKVELQNVAADYQDYDGERIYERVGEPPSEPKHVVLLYWRDQRTLDEVLRREIRTFSPMMFM